MARFDCIRTIIDLKLGHPNEPYDLHPNIETVSRIYTHLSRNTSD